jgi:glycosyltransferase involved in cell wall biosynthesis
MNELPKILIVHNYYQIPGGEDTVVENEKKLLEANGHKVILYTRNNSELKTFNKMQKLFLGLTTIFSIKTYIDVRKIIKLQKIDIVHVHNTLNLVSPSVYYSAFSCKVPVVQTIHNFRLLCPGATFYREGSICEDCIKQGLSCAVRHRCYRGRRLETLVCVLMMVIHRMVGTYRRINYICLSEFNRAKILQLNKSGKRQMIDPKMVYLKPNFTFEYSRCLSREYYLFIGRVEKIKGMDVLLQAFSFLTEYSLMVAGTGTELESYKKAASGMNNVTFLGYQNRVELSETLSHAKAVIVPSQWYETFGMIIAEAYSCYVPAIVGDIGNIGVLVDDGVTGIKFNYDSAEGLINAITRFEHAQIDVWGNNAYQKYKIEFSPDCNYSTLKHIYESVRR